METIDSSAPSLPSPLTRHSATFPARRTASRWRGKTNGDAIFRYTGVLLLLALWAAGSAAGLIPEDALPSPWTVVATAQSLIADGQLVAALLVSLRRVVIGLTLGVSAGAILAVIAGLSRWGNNLIDSPMQMLRTLPPLALAPLFIVWFGIDEAPKIYLIAIAVAFPVYLNFYGGIKAIDPQLLEAARSFGLSQSALVRHVVIPSALASFLVGLRYSAGVAWLVLVVSEQINADAGIGYLMTNAANFLRTDIIVVGLVVYAALGLLTDALIRYAEARALAWRR